MLNCQHHVSWVREVAGGLHQCILCTQVVTKKDVVPRVEDLPEDFQRRWDAWEATQHQPAPAPASAASPAAAAPSAGSPSASPAPAASSPAPAARQPEPRPAARAPQPRAFAPPPVPPGDPVSHP